jgi:hypothetical protein
MPSCSPGGPAAAARRAEVVGGEVERAGVGMVGLEAAADDDVAVVGGERGRNVLVVLVLGMVGSVVVVVVGMEEEAMVVVVVVDSGTILFCFVLVSVVGWMMVLTCDEMGRGMR